MPSLMPQGSASITAEAGEAPMALSPAMPAAAPRKLRREVSVFIVQINSIPLRKVLLGSPFERGDTGELDAGQEFERGAATGRDVRYLVRDAGDLNSLLRIAATDDARGARCSDRLCH